MAYYLVLIIGALFSLFFCVKRSKGFSVGNLLLKVISSLFFLLSGVTALICNGDAYIYAALVIFGGILGLVGDALLDMKGIYPQNEKTYMLGGFIAFLVGHIFYSTAIILVTGMKWWIALLCIIFAILFSIGNYASAGIMKLNFGEYKAIVLLYVVFLVTTMALSIVAAVMSHFDKKYVILAIGSISFTLSDVVLSGTYFGEGKDRPFDYFINHFLYYAGQYMIASTIMFM